MALRNIRLEDDEILRKKSRHVTKIDEKVLTLLDDMAETMYHSNGIGLAAPQVGILRRLVVIDASDDRKDLIELINPEIIEQEGFQTTSEGCLSIPGKSGQVERPLKLKVQAQNRKGEIVFYYPEEVLAVVFCHEIDHLDGILYSDKLVEGTELVDITQEEQDEE